MSTPARARSTMSPPADTLHDETVRAVSEAYQDLLRQTCVTLATLHACGAQGHADALAADAMKLARKGRLHLRQLAAQARREAAHNDNGEHAA